MQDIRLVPAAMNGFKYCISLAIGLGLSTETEALTAQLAKSTSKRNGSGDGTSGDGPDSHLQEEWFQVRYCCIYLHIYINIPYDHLHLHLHLQTLLSLAARDREEALVFVAEAVEIMKKDFVREIVDPWKENGFEIWSYISQAVVKTSIHARRPRW